MSVLLGADEESHLQSCDLVLLEADDHLGALCVHVTLPKHVPDPFQLPLQPLDAPGGGLLPPESPDQCCMTSLHMIQ